KQAILTAADGAPSPLRVAALSNVPLSKHG
ncbi:MAG: hypothetical protein QOC83_5647, partial [Pseudonocardiales bacterium]|nr:hypothetical protein [Pseudonocardiales bacterium]